MKQELLRQIPKVDEVLMDKRLSVFFDTLPRELIVEGVRETIEELRARILAIKGNQEMSISREVLLDEIITKITEKAKKNLRRTINATGIVLHTNLGRAKLCRSACESVLEVAKNYSNLEYDVKKGIRGSRHDHIEELITKITGAEAALIVNNNAAATMITLAAMAEGKEVIVSRGELVEIGGSFRIPDILAQSGADLIEVGTTNKTKLGDYREAVGENTGALLKVHTSNYKIIGFTAEASLNELVSLGKERKIPIIYDMGSGLLMDLQDYGIQEPTVMGSLKTGIDVILFSGDKLLGGPQGGIIAGKKTYIEAMKKHPLARAMRVDKMTLAAMEATFREYLDFERAKSEIPVLSMLTVSENDLKERAFAFADRLKKAFLKNGADRVLKSYSICAEKSQDQIGGGSAPGVILPGYAVVIAAENEAPLSLDKLEKALRDLEIPIIIRISHEKAYIDMRTIIFEEEELIIKSLCTLFSESVEEN